MKFKTRKILVSGDKAGTYRHAIVSIPNEIFEIWEQHKFTEVSLDYDDRSHTLLVIPM